MFMYNINMVIINKNIYCVLFYLCTWNLCDQTNEIIRIPTQVFFWAMDIWVKELIYTMNMVVVIMTFSIQKCTSNSLSYSFLIGTQMYQIFSKKVKNDKSKLKTLKNNLGIPYFCFILKFKKNATVIFWRKTNDNSIIFFQSSVVSTRLANFKKAKQIVLLFEILDRQYIRLTEYTIEIICNVKNHQNFLVHSIRRDIFLL